jgi:hypothetical protein
MRDLEPPHIAGGRESIRVRATAGPRRKGGITLPVWEVLAVPVRDEGSGVDPASVQAWLDGNAIIVEPDPPRDRLLVELPDDLAAGDHVLGLEIADRAGNFAARTVSLRCIR